MAKVLVTGSNGFLGANLIKKLQGEGHEVSALVRKTSNLDEISALKPKLVFGDITDYSSLTDAFKNQEAVFHLAGLIAYKRSQRVAMEHINVDGTKNVISACHHCHVGRLIHMSSVVAIGAGYSSQQILNEDSPFNVSKLNLGYFESKRKAEILVQEASRNLIDAVILNPSTIYGPGDARKGSRLTQLKVARGKFPFYTAGGVSVADSDNVVQAIVRAWQVGRRGERYILGGENITIKKLFELIAHAAGVKAPQIYMPTPVLFAMGHLGDFLELFGAKPSLSVENAWTATLYHWFDSGKAQKELAFKVQPAEISIEKSVRWMKENQLI